MLICIEKCLISSRHSSYSRLQPTFQFLQLIQQRLLVHLKLAMFLLHTLAMLLQFNHLLLCFSVVLIHHFFDLMTVLSDMVRYGFQSFTEGRFTEGMVGFEQMFAVAERRLLFLFFDVGYTELVVTGGKETSLLFKNL